MSTVRRPPRFARGAPARVGVAVAGCALVVSGVAVFGNAHPAHDVTLLSGAAWLASPKVGQAVLLDGSSAEVSAQVRVASAGAELDVVQQGTTAYAVDRTAGTIRRVDGATFELTDPRSPIPDAHAGLTAVAGPNTLYTVDGQRGILAQTDPRTLTRQGGLITLAGRLAEGTATVDEAGRLWAVDTETGDLVRVGGGRRSTQHRVVRPGPSLLTLAGGAPVVVDPVGRKAITVDPDTGATRATLDLDLRPDDRIEVSGSPHAARLYVVAARGTLYVCELVASSCDTVVPLGAGAEFGAAVEAGNRVFVPDYSTGQVWIVDLDQSRVVARPQVLTPAGRFQLLTRDGIVFYNDPGSERAGVIHLDGTVAHARKYDPNDPTKGLRAPEPGPSPSGPAPTGNTTTQPNPTTSRTEPPSTTGTPPTGTPPTGPTPGGGPPPGQVNPRITLSNTNPAVNESVTLQVTNPGGTAPAAAHWTFGDGGEADGPTTEHRWTTARTFQVGVQATLPDGRTATTSASITVRDRPTVRLTVNVPGGGGTVRGSAGGISCPGQCTADFDPAAHDTVTLTATPDGTHLAGTWSGACTGSAATCTVTMDAARTVGYQFVTRDPRVTYTITPPSGGTISIDGTTCPSTCVVQADRGQNVTLTATPDGDHVFGQWTGGCPNRTVASCTITSNADMTVAATFTLKTYVLTVKIDSPGPYPAVSGSPGVDCDGPVCTYTLEANTKVDLTAWARAVCTVQFVRWHDDCAASASNKCAFTMTRDMVATAEFQVVVC